MIWKDFDWPVIESLKEDFNPGDNHPPGTQPGSSQLPTPLRCVPKTGEINSGGGNPTHGNHSQGHLSQTNTPNRTDKMDQPNVALASFLFYVLLPASLGKSDSTKNSFLLIFSHRRYIPLQFHWCHLSNPAYIMAIQRRNQTLIFKTIFTCGTHLFCLLQFNNLR